MIELILQEGDAYEPSLKAYYGLDPVHSPEQRLDEAMGSIRQYHMSRCAARAGVIKLSNEAMEQIKHAVKVYLEDHVQNASAFCELRQSKEISIEDAARALELDHHKYSSSFSGIGLHARPFGGISELTDGEYTALWSAAVARVDSRETSALHWLRELACGCAGASHSRKQELLKDCKLWKVVGGSGDDDVLLAKAVDMAPSLLGMHGAEVEDSTLLREAAELALEASRDHDEVVHMQHTHADASMQAHMQTG